MRRWVFAPAVLALLAMLVISASPAEAHAVYISSSPPANGIFPTAPTAVSVTLSEAVQPGTQTLRVTNASGVREEMGKATISPIDPRIVTIGLAPIGPGVSTVQWIVEDAVDGHWTSGSFYFMVQNPDGSLPGTFPGGSTSYPPISLAEVFLRFVAFLSLAIAFGGTVLAIVAWIPAGRDLENAGDSAFESGFAALLLWARLGALLFAAAAGGWWVHAVTEAPPEVVPVVIGSAFSLTLIARALLGLALAAVLSLAIARARPWTPGEDRAPMEREADAERALLPLLAALILGLFAVFAGTAGSHAAATAVSILGAGMDLVHQIGVYTWVGGLLGIVRLRRWLRAPEGLLLARGVYARFSQLAGYAVALVLGAGVVLGLLLVGTVTALLGTGYGWTLLGKIALFIPMVSLGAYNRYRVLPASSMPDALPRSMGSLAENVRIEAVIGAVVLMIAALLTASTPPATAPATNLFALQATSDGVRFDLEVDPFPTVPGSYTFQVLLSNATTGVGLGGTRSANLTLTLLDGTPTPQTIRMDGPHGNHYFVDTSLMSAPGTWRVDLDVVPATGPTISATFHIVLQ